jgi:hypothetical protein
VCLAAAVDHCTKNTCQRSFSQSSEAFVEGLPEMALKQMQRVAGSAASSRSASLAPLRAAAAGELVCPGLVSSWLVSTHQPTTTVWHHQIPSLYQGQHGGQEQAVAQQLWCKQTSSLGCLA